MSSLIIFAFNSAPELLQSGAAGSPPPEAGLQTDACSSSSPSSLLVLVLFFSFLSFLKSRV